MMTLRHPVVTKISPYNLAELRFFQFRELNSNFLVELAGTCDIKITDLPHYAFARDLTAGENSVIDEGGMKSYKNYLNASWRNRAEHERQNQVASFIDYFDKIRNGEIRPERAILTRLTPNGPLYIVDGNHRCAFSLALERPLEAEIWSFDLIFQRYSPKTQFYETNQTGKPYHTIRLNKEILVPGRRDDIEERIAMIPSEVIKDKSILDIGANIGMNAIAAKHAGAASVEGLEISRGMSDWANRFAAFSGYYPNVSVRHGDAGDPAILSGRSYDTIFMMSVFAHIRDKMVLSRIARDHAIKYVVFECHPRTTWATYEPFFKGTNFVKKKILGILNTSVEKPVPSRELWLLMRDF